MHKVATIATKLQPHQERAIKRALLNDIIFAHSTGSGKTLTAIAAADRIGKPVTVFTPASLTDNFKKELLKHKQRGPKFSVHSLPTAASRGIKVPAGNTVIIDEAHTLRNVGTQRSQYLREQLAKAGRVIALTGTPAYNNITDWLPLVNTVARKRIIPEDPKLFNQEYLSEEQIQPGLVDRYIRGIKPSTVTRLKNSEQLRALLSPYVDVFDADIEKPKRIDETIHVPMSDHQERVYDAVNNKLPFYVRYKVLNNLPPSKAEARDFNAFLTGVRQVSNSTEGYDTKSGEPGPKIRVAVENLKRTLRANPKARALVYSNFIESGLGSYAKLLDRDRIPYAMFHGGLTSKQKRDIVDRYNAGKLPVILGSGSASEGLDLKNTRLIQILEPHFNDAKINQVIGRGIRYKSHAQLPESERNVTVQRYMSDKPQHTGFLWFKPERQLAVDEYLSNRAREKQTLIDDFKHVLEQR